VHPNRSDLVAGLWITAACLLGGCVDSSQSPPAHPDTSLKQLDNEGGNLAPLDLVYVCGNKFLATNSTRATVHLTYRVLGTEEIGGVTLPPGPSEDPGHSETELETKNRGMVELYQDDRRVVKRRNERLPCGLPAQVMADAVAGSSAPSGSWTAPFPWPVVAIHLSLLPDGRVLSWGNAGDPQIWDPASGNFTAVASPAELFCAGHSFLPDGSLLVSGGHIASDRGIANNSIFSLATGGWTASTPMRRGRWYPTNTTLANGSVVILAGRDEVGDEVAEPEVWTPNGIRVLTGASLVLPYYPRTFLAPNGRIFYAGELGASRYLNTSGSGAWTNVGSRRYGNRPYGAAVMYDAGKILYVGGGRTTNTAEIIDLNAATPAWQWTGSMAFARRNLNATILPTGEVLVTGGSSGSAFNDLTQAVRAAEIWNPGTGIWTTLGSNAVKRTYHSTSLLLPDGRVLHAGSGEGADMPEERNAELFSPPYLFNGARPTIDDAPAQVGYGTSFTIVTPQAADIQSVSLIRLGSVTHAFDMNQRFQRLPFVRQSGALSVSAPASGTRAPPGHYMIFILNGNGVPSEAKIVKVGPTSEPSPTPNTAPVAAFIAGCSGLNCSFFDRSADPDGNLTAWTWNFGDGGGAGVRDPNHAYDAAGSYTVTLTAQDAEGATKAISKQVTVPGPQFPIGLSLTTRSDATGQYVDLVWSGAQSQTVYVYRDGLVHIATPNDGRHTVTRSFTDPATYYFKVCEAATTICSNVGTAQFEGGAPTDNAPPNAVFTPSCTGLTCRFSDGSADTDGNVTGWQWTFGDGSSSSLRSPSHTYASGGTHGVTLRVTDNRGSSGSATKQVTVEGGPNGPPNAAFSSSCDDLDCDFTDGSTDADGNVTGWQWDFGDGSSADVRHPSHEYAGEGTYTVTLTVTDDDDAEASTSSQVTVTPPGPNADPVADFTPSCTGLTCAFTDGSTDSDGNIAGWQWDFGDGANANVESPTHPYTGEGSYTVALTVTDNDGAQASTSREVTVTRPPNVPPAADFTSSCTGLTCTFTDRSTDGDGSVTGWSWGFGDGATSTARNPSRTYAAAGAYTVTLTATDNESATGERSAPVTVTAPAAIVLAAKGRVDGAEQISVLTWTGATSARVDIYRNGVLVNNSPNDGRQAIRRTFSGPATYVFKVCHAGTTTVCSNQATVVFK
jgi:PKD repeat protein